MARGAALLLMLLQVLLLGGSLGGKLGLDVVLAGELLAHVREGGVRGSWPAHGEMVRQNTTV